MHRAYIYLCVIIWINVSCTPISEYGRRMLSPGLDGAYIPTTKEVLNTSKVALTSNNRGDAHNNRDIVEGMHRERDKPSPVTLNDLNHTGEDN